MAADPRSPRNGRYAGLPVLSHVGRDGRETVYLARRFLPQPEALTFVQEHVVREGERLDQIASRYFGEPELAWRLCDANRAMDPQALTAEPGRRLAITLAAELSWPGSERDA
jgi:hypothetical protein